MEVSTPEAMSCPFLSLPGELRNRIYDYCVERGPIILPVADPRRRTRTNVYFGNLRYACRTLYVEFAPAYLAETTVHLDVAHIGRYLSAVYPTAHYCEETNPSEIMSPNVALNNTHGKVRINIRFGQVLDMSPLVGLRSRLPGLCIKFACGAAISPIMRDAGEFLTRLLNGSCSIDIRGAVERVLFRYSLRAEVVVKLQREMSFDNIFERDQARSPRQWLTQQGSPVMKSITIVMESAHEILRDPGHPARGAYSSNSSQYHTISIPVADTDGNRQPER
jgi:hypothetical protein